MTDLYDYKGLSANLDLTCPKCGVCAQFTSLFSSGVPVMTEKGKSWEGKLTCPSCHYVNTHHVKWPEEAYYKVEYKGEDLWAHNRQMMEDILDYIKAGPDRDHTRKRSDYFVKIVHIPSIFLSTKARDTLSKKIKALLDD